MKKHEEYVVRDSRGDYEKRAGNSLEAIQTMRTLCRATPKADRVFCYVVRPSGHLQELLSMAGER